MVICIDEFQQIGEFANSPKFQKILRNHWQEQQDVAYVLYGSKKHMMLNIFGEYKSPFYKFGDIMFLPKSQMTIGNRILAPVSVIPGRT